MRCGLTSDDKSGTPVGVVYFLSLLKLSEAIIRQASKACLTRYFDCKKMRYIVQNLARLRNGLALEWPKSNLD